MVVARTARGTLEDHAEVCSLSVRITTSVVRTKLSKKTRLFRSSGRNVKESTEPDWDRSRTKVGPCE